MTLKDMLRGIGANSPNNSDITTTMSRH